MNQKELTKTFMMNSNWKKHFVFLIYLKHFSILRAKGLKYIQWTLQISCLPGYNIHTKTHPSDCNVCEKVVACLYIRNTETTRGAVDVGLPPLLIFNSFSAEIDFNPLSAGDAFKRIHTVFPQLKFDRNWTNMHVWILSKAPIVKFSRVNF